jgi:transcriptional regulator with XRE-family HTH domain
VPRAERIHGDRVRFGARLRHAREASRLSLGDVAARSGVTKGFLSRVERDETSPSVASLLGICEALGLSMAELFQTPSTTFVRRADRPRIADLPKAADVIDTLITPAGERHVTVLETIAAPGSSGGDVLYTLPSECEVCFVLQGAIEVRIEDETFRLEEGDALTFGAAVPHTWQVVPTGAGARVLWILAPALPDPQGSVR